MRSTRASTGKVSLMSEDPELETRRIAHESLDRDDPTGWFENLYSAASAARP
ncbi:hypothetical protein GCM10009745_75640 [Kribbella yunnanensis]|uniref:Uncharacterized protein n=1 Tax=Kribbella yunnanensis TaxID=190194 RepID=A0ABP4V419_9ACTN